MTMMLRNLDSTTRGYMRDEVALDIASDDLYISGRLSPDGAIAYPDMLLNAIDRGDASSFAADLSQPGVLNEMEMSQRNGKPYAKRVPVNAAQTLAEGEFNRFYARGLCRRAITEDVGSVRVYRAKAVENPRTASVEMIGAHLDAASLLDDLRTHIAMDTALRLPPGPNSGLSVELVS